MILPDGHPLKLESFDAVRNRLREEMIPARRNALDISLNMETRYEAFGRANLAEQMLICMGDDGSVMQTIDG